MALVDNIEEILNTLPFVASACRFSNTVGTPLVNAVDNASGEAIPDIYLLTFTTVVASTSAKVVVTASPANPYNNAGGISILLNNSATYTNIIPGITLGPFSNSGSFSNLWTAQVRVGTYYGTLPAFGAGAGAPGASQQHKVTNTSGSPATTCIAGLRN